MKNYRILNKKDIKEILSLIKSQWDAEVELDYGFLQDREEKIYLINRQFAEIPLDKLRINKIGLYFGQVVRGELRLSIEGSQIIGPEAKKNVLEINEEETREWLNGNDLETTEHLSGFMILKHEKDFFGTGKFKEGKILNFIPKGRRLKTNE